MDTDTDAIHKLFEAYVSAAHEHEREAERLASLAHQELTEAARIAEWLHTVWGEDPR